MSLRKLNTVILLVILVGSFLVISVNVAACFTIEVELTDGDDEKFADGGEEYALYEIMISLSPGCKHTYWLSYDIDGVGPGWDAVLLNESGGEIDLAPTEYVYSGTVQVYVTLKHITPVSPQSGDPNTVSVYIYANDYYNQESTLQQDVTTIVNEGEQSPNPVFLSESGSTTSQINLTWTESELNPIEFDRYELHTSNVPDFTPVSGTLLETITDKGTNTSQVTGLSPGTMYYFCVRVWDRSVLRDPFFADSNVLAAATPGINYPPTAVILYTPDPQYVTNKEADLEWTQNFDDDFAYYELHATLTQDFVPSSETRFVDPIFDQTTVTYTVIDLWENKTIYFKIRVVDAGNMYNDSNEENCATLDYLPTPAILKDPYDTDTAKTSLIWSQNHDSDFSRYEVHKSETQGFTPSIDTLVESFTDTFDNSTTVYALSEATTYYFVIRTVDVSGKYSDSNEVFTTTLDGTLPQITLTAPVNNVVDVDVDVNVVITFSEKIDSSTLLYTCTPDPGGWIVSWDAEGMEVTLSHSNDFDDSTKITLEVTQAKDMGGNTLDTQNKPVPNPFSFTTKDLTPPEITQTTPADDASDIFCDCDISITFSEDMDESSVEGAITAPFTYEASWNGNTLTLTPESDLDYSTEYIVQVKTTAKDSAGNNLGSKYTFSFTTEEEDINHAPEVTVSSPSDDDADDTFTIEWSATDIDGDPITISIYYDTDSDDSYGLKLIKSGYSNSGSYEWDTSDIPEGDYYIYIKANDGLQDTGVYSGKLTIAHAEDPGTGGVDPEGSEDVDYFPLILLILVIAAILVMVLVGIKALGSKKPQGQAETITCPQCRMQFTADTTVSPYVTCPNCGTSGMMR